jgi:DNA topoisomerase IB
MSGSVRSRTAIFRPLAATREAANNTAIIRVIGKSAMRRNMAECSPSGAVLTKIRKQVNEDLSAAGLPQRKVIAAIVRLLDETCIRIGNEEYAKSNKAYGLTTLKDQHVDVHGDNVRLHFRCKSKQDHDITLRDRRLTRIVKQLQDLPGQELFQYRQANGDYVKIDSADVNDYLRKVTQEDLTAKDFRTWHGTGHMAQELAAIGPAHSETEAKRNIVEAVKLTPSGSEIVPPPAENTTYTRLFWKATLGRPCSKR